MASTHRTIPLNIFAIPFGVLGLADCWLVAATFGLAPVVAGRLLAAAAVVVWAVAFGLGLVCWVVLGSIMLGRLVLGPPLPPALTPTIAIEVAPAAVATFAAFVIDGHQVDNLVRLLAGYGLLMVVAQVRLLPAYRRLSFSASFWAFTFSWAAVCFAGLFWLGVTQQTGWRASSYVALVLITGFIGAVAARTGVALRRGQLLPSPAPPASRVVAAPVPVASVAVTGS
jgi:tellurite resistance protein